MGYDLALVRMFKSNERGFVLCLVPVGSSLLNKRIPKLERLRKGEEIL